MFFGVRNVTRQRILHLHQRSSNISLILSCCTYLQVSGVGAAWSCSRSSRGRWRRSGSCRCCLGAGSFQRVQRDVLKGCYEVRTDGGEIQKSTLRHWLSLSFQQLCKHLVWHLQCNMAIQTSVTRCKVPTQHVHQDNGTSIEPSLLCICIFLIQ